MIRQFFIKISFLFLPIIILIAGVNYFVDPANVFLSKAYINGIATILSSGHNVENISNYDERLLQEQMAIHLKNTPDILVVGSSRIMEVGRDFFPGKNVINCAVSHANIKDIIAIAGLLDTMKHLPDVIYLNADDGLVGNEYTQEWQSLEKYYNYFFRQYPAKENVHNDIHPGVSYNKIGKEFSSLFSIAYFQSAIDFLIKRRTKKYIDAGTKIPELGGRFADGTVSYNYDYKHRESIHTALVAKETGRKHGVALPDEKQIQLFLSFLNFCKDKNITVILVMIPYHPEFYASVNQYYDNAFFKYEAYYRALAKSRNLEIIGSLDASTFNISGTMFYDMYHASKEAIGKIITK